MEEKKGESKVWVEIGTFKEGRLCWIEPITERTVKAMGEEALEDALARRLDSLKKVGAWQLRTRTCRFENGRSHFENWEEVN